MRAEYLDLDWNSVEASRTTWFLWAYMSLQGVSESQGPLRVDYKPAGTCEDLVSGTERVPLTRLLIPWTFIH